MGIKNTLWSFGKENVRGALNITPEDRAVDGLVRTALPFAPLVPVPFVDQPLRRTKFPEAPNLSAHDWLAKPTLTELWLRCKGSYLVLRDCVCTVSIHKNIVHTYLSGRNGSVKEYINDRDYRISIIASLTPSLNLNPNPDGLDNSGSNQNILDVSDGYPKDKVKNLMHLLRMNTAIEVVSDFLDLFNIRSMVIEGYDFDQGGLYQNQQSFSLYGLSDTPFEIKLKKSS